MVAIMITVVAMRRARHEFLEEILGLIDQALGFFQIIRSFKITFQFLKAYGKACGAA